jgi:uncharacterized protein (TIGR02118 family)
MLKIIAMFKFRADKPHEESMSYWNDVHSTVVPKCLPQSRRYVQNVPVPIRGKDWGYDGVSELWFEDMAAIRDSFEGPLADDLRKDEENFADADRSHWIIVSENEVIAFSPTAGASA